MQRLLLATLMAASLAAYADTPPVTVPPPPATLSGPQPEVRVYQNGPDTVEEYRMNGKVYMVKVTPQGAPAYFMMDEDGKGVMQRVSPSQQQVTPRWVLMTF